MAWLPALAFAAIAFAASAVAWTLTANLEAQPEYPTVMTDTLRAIGGLIAAGGAVFGTVFLYYATRAYLGW